MAEIYARLIRAGLKTLEDVPKLWKSKVESILQGGDDKR